MYDTCHTKLQNLRGKWLWPLYKFANHLVLINHKFIILRGKGAELQVSVPGPLALKHYKFCNGGICNSALGSHYPMISIQQEEPFECKDIICKWLQKQIQKLYFDKEKLIVSTKGPSWCTRASDGNMAYKQELDLPQGIAEQHCTEVLHTGQQSLSLLLHWFMI